MGAAPVATAKGRPYGATLAFGVVAVALYTALYLEEGTVNELYTRGGLYAFLPILTAFVFSFVHGSFTGNFWSSLGVEASKARKEVK